MTPWEQMKSCIVDAAEESLGRSWKKQPDWLLESTDVVMPLIKAKMLPEEDFRSHQRQVKKAVDATKEKWVRRIAQSA